MYYNSPLTTPIKDKIQDGIGNLQTEKEKSSDSYSEKPLSKDKKRHGYE